MPGPFLLVLAVCLAIVLPALAYPGPVLIHAQPALQLLRAALLLGRRVPFALLLVQRIELLLQGADRPPYPQPGAIRTRQQLRRYEPYREPGSP
jgi:hypothetical protein